MPLTTCTYQLVNMSVGPSQIQKLALKAWACLRLAPAALVKPELSQAGQSRHALAAYSGKSIDTQPVWKQQVRENITGVHVADMRLWFNNCTNAATPSRMHMPSTDETEKEAIEWAQAGLIRNKDVINGTRIQGTSAFRNKHPTLDTSLIHATRTDMPEEYRIALEDGTHMSQAEHDCLPRGLLDDEQDDRRQHMAVVVPPTLINRPIIPVAKLSISSIYSTLSATEFDTPRVFNPAAGEAARHLHLFNDVDPALRTDAIARAVAKVRHPAVPPEMTETAYNVMMSGFRWGPHKKNVQGRQQCPCGKGHDETVHHTFKDCTRSRRLHEMTLKQWREVTGETKVKASEGRITLLGDRSCTWLDDAEQSEIFRMGGP